MPDTGVPTDTQTLKQSKQSKAKSPSPKDKTKRATSVRLGRLPAGSPHVETQEVGWRQVCALAGASPETGHELGHHTHHAKSDTNRR